LQRSRAGERPPPPGDPVRIPTRWAGMPRCIPHGGTERRLVPFRRGSVSFETFRVNARPRGSICSRRVVVRSSSS
jgi:hypothetical protein